MSKFMIETSARHIHLSRKDVETLFGAGYQLTKKKDLSQPGQFACAEKVTVVGENFTLSSRITVDGEPLKTTRNPDGSLSAKLSDDLEVGDAVTVAQYTSENTFLGETDPFYYE